MRGNKYKSYDRIHKYQNPSDVESGKIKRETINYIKHSKKSKELSRKLTHDFETSDNDLLEDYEEAILDTEKEMKNARGHKNRLKELSKNQDFI